METRSSPSLCQLQRLARQAHIGAHDFSAMSKPALFGHLRANYDYNRLERAHHIALKRDIGRGKECSTTASSSSSSSSARSTNNNGKSSKKRQCLAGRDARSGGGRSSPSADEEQGQGLPPASIFIQTRSRSRMLLRAAEGNANADQPSAPTARPSTSPRARTKLKLAGGIGKRGGGSGSGGGGSGSSSSVPAAAAAADAACGFGSSSGDGAEPAANKAEDDVEASEGSENTAKRKGQQQQQQQQPQPQPRRNGKGKAKARDSSGGSGDGDKGRSCDPTGSSSTAQGGVEKQALNLPNELDPIMLVKVGKDHYRFVRPNGIVVMYNLDSLVDYFISTGDFLEPETRLPFSDDQLRDIDGKAKAAGLSKPSVLAAKRDPGRYAEQKFQQDALVGLERMTSELVTGMLRVVEECDREEGEIRLVADIFPPFADLFKQILAADKAFALQCMQHYRSWLEGPPNRPTEDEMGFLDIIISFLTQLEDSGGNSQLGF